MNDKYEEASGKYEAAILLYEKTQNIVWFSICYAELCICSAKIGDSDKVMECLEKMFPLLEALPYDNVKSYCAYKAKEALEMMGESF